ncbi:MAG: TatD family hydrolase, partial [Clostridia bacterium]|nr:TatD family hydrolase [Clostridia bacterium]
GAIGCQPHNASRYDDAAERVILDYLKREKCLLWGEIGLDYHYDLSPRDVQKNVFERQLRLAHEQGKTVQLHIREAHEDSLEILNRLKSEGKLPKGIVHCFTGDWETAQKYLALDYYISFSGAMTFKNGTAIADAATKVPEDRLLVETDAPYMAPVPLRGKRNEPAFVSHTFAKLAALREKSPDALAERLWANSLTALGIQ